MDVRSRSDHCRRGHTAALKQLQGETRVRCPGGAPPCVQTDESLTAHDDARGIFRVVLFDKFLFLSEQRSACAAHSSAPQTIKDASTAHGHTASSLSQGSCHNNRSCRCHRRRRSRLSNCHLLTLANAPLRLQPARQRPTARWCLRVWQCSWRWRRESASVWA